MCRYLLPGLDCLDLDQGRPAFRADGAKLGADLGVIYGNAPQVAADWHYGLVGRQGLDAPFPEESADSDRRDPRGARHLVPQLLWGPCGT